MILDQIIALRVLYLLVLPFEKHPAYKLGVIDSNGNPKLKIADMNPAQKNSYTMLHRLCFRLKKVLGVLPFGKTTLASMAAAYVLVRESMEAGEEREDLELIFEERLKQLPITESTITDSEVENMFVIMEKVLAMMEDGVAAGVPTNTTAGVSAAATNTPVIKPKAVYASKDKFKLIKASTNRKIKMMEELGIDDADIVVCEETNECLVL